MEDMPRTKTAKVARGTLTLVLRLKGSRRSSPCRGSAVREYRIREDRPERRGTR